MDANDSTRVIINKETGEVEAEIYPGDKLVRASSISYLLRNNLEFNKGATFVKLYDEIVPYLVKHLNGTELKYILLMANHVSYKDCVLRKTNNNLSSPMTATEFCKIHNLNYNTVKKVFSNLKQKGVIAYVETGTILEDCVGVPQKIYLVNPYIYFRGHDINDTAKSIFDNSGWKEQLLN